MIRLFKRYYSIRKLLFFLGEGFFILLSFLVVVSYRHYGAWSIFQSPPLWGRLFLILLVCQTSLYYCNLYQFRAGFSYAEMTTRLFQALGGACIFLGFLYFAFPVLLPGRWIFVVSLLAFIVMSSLWRYAYCLILWKGWWTTPLLIVGDGAFPLQLLKEVQENTDCGYHIAGVVWRQPRVDSPELADVRTFSSFSQIWKRAQELEAETIVVAMDERRGHLPVEELLNCKVRGLPVVEGETFYEQLTGKILVEKINPSWLIFQEGFQKSWLTIAGKRLVSFSASAVGLVLSLPILVLTTILIKLDSPGPILFRQERVGKDGKTFVLVKFRSMRVDAEDGTAQWAARYDDRATRIGKIIRKLRIDEIPQMWNVLKGEMGFVGPRPERPVFVKRLREKIPYYDQRHSVRPGLTGWAQVSYPYGASEEDAMEKLKYDLYYIKHMSVILDLYIILKTVKTILLREGAR